MSLYQAYVKQPPKPRRHETDAAEMEIDSLTPVEWPQVLADLNAAGWSDNRIAQTIDVPGSTLKRYKTGSVPNFESGRKLLALLRKIRNCATSSAREGV